MTVKYLKEFIFQNYDEQIGYIEKDSCYSLWRVDLLLLATKLTKILIKL